MVDELHDRDIRLHLWQIPLIKMRPHPAGQVEADADAAMRDGVLIREPAPDGSLRPYRNRGWWFPLGLMPDLTDERAARWWTDKRRYLVEELGIDGFKTDGGEHAWGRELRLPRRPPRRREEQHLPGALREGVRRPAAPAGKAPVTFSRAGFTGSQAHGAFWAGDENSTWEAFRWSLFAGLNAAASGIVYWGWDLAGFSGDVPTAELYLRSAAAATFVPIMQYHSEFNHHRTPVARPHAVEHRRALGRRPRAAGVPLVRRSCASGSCRTCARRRRARSRRGSRSCGRCSSTARTTPRCGSTRCSGCSATRCSSRRWSTRGRRRGRLPAAGDWGDAFTGEAVDGGRVVARPTPIDELPVWVRAEDWESNARRSSAP